MEEKNPIYEVCTISEASELYHIAKSTLTHWISGTNLTECRLKDDDVRQSGKIYIIRKSAIEREIRKGKI